MKKFHAKKIAIASVFACSALVLASVGFANWVISGSNTASVASLEVTTAEVTDKRITLTAEATDRKVNFGPTKTSGNTIQPSGEDSEEDLSFTLKITLKGTSSSEITAGDIIKVVFKFDGTNGINDYLNQEVPTSTYLTNDFLVFTLENEIILTDEQATSAKSDSGLILSEQSFAFTWGGRFSNKNPADYWGADGSSKLENDTLDNVIADLKKLKTATTNTTFSCEVSFNNASA